MTTKEGRAASAPDFFVSYTAHDVSWAEWLAYQLEDAGYSTVLQAWDFKAGQNFVREMHQAAQFSHRTLGVLSQDYLSSEWCQAEMLAALADDPLGKNQKFIGVKIAPCNADGLLAGRVYIDLQSKDELAARTFLLDEIKKTLNTKRNKPIDAPAFPDTSESNAATVARRVSASSQATTRYPNSKPPFLNTPIGVGASDSFVGRHEIYQATQAALLGTKAMPVMVCGSAGVGKTMLVMRLAQGAAHAFDAVCWINAETDTSLSNDFAGLAEGLELNLPTDTQRAQRIEAVKTHINQSAKVLLVLDNVKDAKNIAPYMPSSTGVGSRALLTSRAGNWDGMQRFNLDVFTPDEAAQFWQTHGQGEWLNDAAELATAHLLAHELGQLPLALRQAAAYMLNAGLAPSDYLTRWQAESNKLELLGSHGDLQDYSKSLAAVLSLALEKLNAQSPEALELLRLCSLLAPDNVPLTLLQKGFSELTGEARVQFESSCPALAAITAQASGLAAWDGIRKALRQSALADCQGQALSWHRLTCLYVRLMQSKEAMLELWRLKAIVFMSLLHTEQDVDIDTSVWPIYVTLLDHMQAWCEHGASDAINLTKPDKLAMANVLNKMGLYSHFIKADYSVALIWQTQALKIFEHLFDEQHPDVAASLNNIAIAYQAQGEYAKALPLHERALKIQEQTLGDQHPDVAGSLNNVAAVYQAQGEYEKALPLHERALKIQEQALGDQHPDVAGSLSSVAEVYKQLGEYEKALPLHERALKIQEQALGDQHPNVASILNNLAMVYKAQGEYAAALPLLTRAHKIWEKVLGDQHPNVAGSLLNLAAVYAEQGDYAKALPLNERALKIWAQVLGDQHPNVAISRHNLATIYDSRGEYAKALPLFEQAVKVATVVLGSEHSHTKVFQSNLASCQAQLAASKQPKP